MTGAQTGMLMAPGKNSAGQTVRRLVVYTLLAVLVGVSAIGVSGLLDLVLDDDTVLAGGNTSSTAQSLAFTLIGLPLAATLWWFAWRRLTDATERGSLAWGLYVAVVTTVSLIVASSALLGVLARLIDGDGDGSGFATAVAWAGVWVLHYRMWRNAARSPIRLATVPAVLGASFGLVVGAGGLIATLARVFDAALASLGATVLIGGAWEPGAAQSLVWGVGGAAVWAWHWYAAGARRDRATFSDVALVVLGILGASIAALGGIGAVLFVLLRLVADRTDPLGALLSPVPAALAAAAVGGVIWLYARTVIEERSPATRHSAVLATSGVALAGAASGLGVIVNAALGILTTPLAGADPRTLLLGGLSALIVGAPVWWFTWRPQTRADASAQSTGRRIYLITIFGISAVVALITLLVIGFRLFEFFLGGSQGLIDRVRAPLGLLTATALVAGYHFSVWRHDRAEAEASAPAVPPRTIGEVILVTAADPIALVRAIEEASGARVTVWRVESAASVPPGVDALVLALDGVTARRVLVVATDHLEVLPLAD
jgi:hypothetical protein